MKLYADSKQYVKPSNIQIGDPVLVRKSSIVKEETPFSTSSFDSGVHEKLFGHYKEGWTANHEKQFILQTFSKICDRGLTSTAW